jgi:uncharacterized protein YoxC
MVKTPKNPKIKIQKQQTAIELFIAWIGSIPSLIFHSILFSFFLVLTITQPAERTSILLIWNTIVSLEAIYLAIFIQFTVNRNTRSLEEVEEDIDEIQEDVEELGEDVDEIQEDIEELSEDIEEISEDADEDEKRDLVHAKTLDQLTSDIRTILDEVESLKKK